MLQAPAPRPPPLCRRLGEPRPELDIDLNPSRPGDRRPEASQLVDGSGPCKYAGESLYLIRCSFNERTLHNWAARLNGIFHRHSFEYGVLRV
jgi:hypothetical protein